MYGDIGENNGNPNGGTFAIDSVKNFGFAPPFSDFQRHILFTNSAYYTEPWLVDYYLHNLYTDTVTIPVNIPRPMPMLGSRTRMFFDTTDGIGGKAYPYMNRANLYEGVNPSFLLPPTDIPAIKRFLYYKWTSNLDTNWAFDPATSVNQTWPLSENLKIAASSPLKTAAMGGFPLGDLYRWDKANYTSWKAQETSENSLIKSRLDNGFTGVADLPGIANKFELGQNYPNPFNPATKIDYAILRSGYVSLKVYDLLGREVATLVAGAQDAGQHTATFDAARFSSGVYFYRLQVGTGTLTRKMVLMK
jgi:hypothetical protein